jgi:hypothetical protein
MPGSPTWICTVIWRHIAELPDLGRGRPILFYRKLGYTVTEVMPDANGHGRLDIYMSKRAENGR